MAENTAEQTRRLVEKFLETGNDAFLDEANECDHDYIHLLPIKRSIVKKYMEHALELHVHFVGIRNMVGSVNESFCATGNYLCDSDCAHGCARTINEPHFSVAPTSHACQSKRPVLINVVKFAQNPQRVIPGEVLELRSFVRLQSLDDCFRLNGYAAKSILAEIQVETGGMKTDRELISVRWRSIVDDYQLSDDVLQCGTKVMEALADNNAEP